MPFQETVVECDPKHIRYVLLGTKLAISLIAEDAGYNVLWYISYHVPTFHVAQGIYNVFGERFFHTSWHEIGNISELDTDEDVFHFLEELYEKI